MLDTLRRVFELHGFASVETRAVEPLEQLLRKGEIDKEVYVLRRLHGATTTSGRRRPRRCTSTSPCRSRATCWRTPATSSSRSVATRSRRCGAASARRRAASASSPRPTSTSSAATPCRSTTRSRSRCVMAEVLPALPVPPLRLILVNNRKLAEGFFLGLGASRRRRRHCARSTRSTRSGRRRSSRAARRPRPG